MFIRKEKSHPLEIVIAIIMLPIRIMAYLFLVVLLTLFSLD